MSFYLLKHCDISTRSKVWTSSLRWSLAVNDCFNAMISHFAQSSRKAQPWMRRVSSVCFQSLLHGNFSAERQTVSGFVLLMYLLLLTLLLFSLALVSLVKTRLKRERNQGTNIEVTLSK